ncbi:MAG TPA: hypothetical protein VNO23_01275 [Candidatus Binatia bacterium]|nr:hypothetical protein [Candidatus Binatia bacterium]
MRRPALLLLVLLLLAGAEQALATVAIVWRGAVVSWDSPASQWQDELACQGATWSDARRQAQSAIAPLAPGGRLPAPPATPGLDTPAGAADHTRSPPAR